MLRLVMPLLLPLLFWIWFCWLTLTTLKTWAADPESDALTKDIVVTATRTPERIGHVPASPTVLTRDDIQKTPFRDGHQADDLIRYIPGVQPSNLSSRYNHPTAQAVTLRGLGSRRALVLLDGVPLNDGFGGWINWGIVPNTIERIEVVPGGGSNLYGTWAMGGVIHIITQQPRVGTGVRAESRAGNLNTYTQALSARYGTERVDLSLSYRWYHTNGFIPAPAYQRGPVDRTNDSRHENVSGTLTAALDSRTRLTLTGNLFREDRAFGTPLSLATRTIGSMAMGLEGETRRSDRWETKLFAQWQTFRNLTSQVTPLPTIRLGEFRDRIQAIPSNDFGGMGQWMVQVTPQHRVVVGSDARAILGQSEERIFSTAGPTGRSLARGKQVGWGVFGEWIVTPTERLSLIPSFRSDWWKNFDGRIESELGAITRPRDNVTHVLNPKLAAQYRVTDRIRAGASVYRAFRAPTLNELYRGFSFGGLTFAPNENLTPERSIGGEAKIEADGLPDHRLNVRVTGHYDEVKDQILFITQGPLTARRQNVGRTRTLGGELDVTFRASEQVSLTAGYAFADSAIKSFLGDKTREGKRVPNVSRHQVTMGVTLGHPNWVEVTIMGRYLSRQFADDLNAQPIADFMVLDVSVQKQIGRSMRLYLDGENLTDRQYIATQTGSIKTLGAPLLVMGGLRLEY
ncbi:MAG: TonB-dependent receptor [Nitrospirae bacterium]|nr:TonB-dependent receptor [Nitrospirota bacterium]